MPKASEPQKVLYERVHSDYAAHCYGPASLAYRREFILSLLRTEPPLNLDQCRLADLACGDGYNSVILKEWFPEVQCVGFDISPSACDEYRRLTGWDAYDTDLTKPLDVQAVGGPYDGAIVIGGLHHTVSNLPEAIKNIAALVRPGGFLYMMEPNNRYFLEGMRRLWYRLDKNFDAITEHALDHAALAEMAAPWFSPLSVRYYGGPAYFLIQTSMITRVPLWLKSRIAPVLMPFERLHAHLPHPRFHAFFTAIWKRNEDELT